MTEREMKTASPTPCIPLPQSLFPPYGETQLYYMRLSPLVHFYFIHFSCSSLPPVFCRTESVGCGPAPGARRSHHAVSCTHSSADNRHANLFISWHFSRTPLIVYTTLVLHHWSFFFLYIVFVLITIGIVWCAIDIVREPTRIPIFVLLSV